MLVVLSPAKSLDFTPAAPGTPMTTPQLKDQIAEVAKVAAKLTRADLRRLMGISEKLADLNFTRFKAFDPACEDGVQAAIAFNGDVYAGLDARSLDKKALGWAQDHVRILSGLYGVLRPLDALQPYRLEMSVRLKIKRKQSLYEYWGSTIAEALNDEAIGHRDTTLVNLASQEYFHSVDREALKLPVVTCHFKEEAAGEVRILSFYAKKARGLMARYVIDNRIDRAEDLKAFDGAGYAFAAALSSDTDWVFTRPHP